MRTLGCILLLSVCALAQEEGYIPSSETGWPQWRGIRRDGISDEKGLLLSWPETGPALLWTAEGLGLGYSSPVIDEDRIYITGDVGEELRVFAMDLSGRKLWETVHGQSWRKNYPGSRACGALSEGRLYLMGAHGRLGCFDVEDGREVWVVDTVERFDSDVHQWGRSECVLVDGNRVIATLGSKSGSMVALNKDTGEVVWMADPVEQEDVAFPGYGSPILLQYGENRIIVHSLLRSVLCVDADSGSVLWTHPVRTKYDASCATPVFMDHGIFHSIPSGAGGVFLEMEPSAAGIRIKERWRCPMDNLSGGVVALDGYLYGSGEYNGGWMCVNGRTGEIHYDDPTLKKGSVIYADGHLYCLEERGTMALVKPTPEGFEIVSRFPFVQVHKNDVWAHPVILDGRLYLRYHDRLFCYAIGASSLPEDSIVRALLGSSPRPDRVPECLRLLMRTP